MADMANIPARGDSASVPPLTPTGWTSIGDLAREAVEKAVRK